MRKLFFYLIIVCSLNTFGQITFSQILSLEDKTYKEIQGFLFSNHSIINQSTTYIYQQYKECNPPRYFEDSCKWKCRSGADGLPVSLKYRTTQPVFKNPSIKNYVENIHYETEFGEDYNSNQNTAVTFITITKGDEWANTNCNNEFKLSREGSVNFSIQFNDTYHWERFKKSVIKNAQFQSVWDPKIEGLTPRARYGIRRKIVNNHWTGVYIQLYEGDEVYYAEISFNSFGVE
jgi:hypothetical protein